MNTQCLAALLLLAALGAPRALACQLKEPPPAPPKVFWQDASAVAAGETAVEVAFVRPAQLSDPKHHDVVIIACGPTHRVYRVVRVLAGDAKEQQEILVPADHDFEGDNAILIGRFITQKQLGWSDTLAPDHDQTLLILEPRLPPQ